jgi:hypothetical protein
LVLNRPGKRATIGLTAILMFLPNAFWKSEPPRHLRIRVEVRAAEMTDNAGPRPIVTNRTDEKRTPGQR